MNNNTKRFLPIGSVVMLNNASRPVMITGYVPIDKSTNTMYDYSACVYPEGIVDNSYTAVFNDSQISEILFKGYKTVEGAEFIKSLKETINNAVKDGNNYNGQTGNTQNMNNTQVGA